MRLCLNKEKALSLVDKAFDYFGNLYVVAIILLIPLYYQNFYFDTLEAKWSIYVFITILFIFPFSLLFIIKIINGYTPKVNKWDIFAVIFCLSVILGNMFSEYPQQSFTGSSGWRLGTLYMILCIFTYFSIKQTNISIKLLFFVFLIMYSLINLLASLNILGFDPLLFKNAMIESEKTKYISTIGNINWFGAFMSLAFPIISILFIISKKVFIKIILGILNAISLFNIVLCNSDCALLSILGIIIFLIYCTVTKKDYYKDFGLYFIISGLALVLIDYIVSYKINIRIENLQKIITSWSLGLIVIVFGVFLCINTGAHNNSHKRVSVCTFFILIIVYFLIFKDYIIEYLDFNYSWGNNRGYIWNYAIEIYSGNTTIKKLFGTGCDTFGIYATLYFQNDIITIWNKQLVNAHNELLQLLVTTGIIGTVSYYITMIFPIVKSIKSNDVFKISVAISLTTYLVQQLVNNMQTVTTPLCFVLLSLLNVLIYTDSETNRTIINSHL